MREHYIDDCKDEEGIRFSYGDAKGKSLSTENSKIGTALNLDNEKIPDTTNMKRIRADDIDWFIFAGATFEKAKYNYPYKKQGDDACFRLGMRMWEIDKTFNK